MRAPTENTIEDAIEYARKRLAPLAKKVDITVELEIPDPYETIIYGKTRDGDLGLYPPETPESRHRDAVKFCVESFRDHGVVEALSRKHDTDAAYIRDAVERVIIPALLAAKPSASKPGRYRVETYQRRDILIVRVLDGLQDRNGFPMKTRNLNNPSCCFIVMKALASLGIHISEKGIKNIWDKRDKLPWKLI
jgi:hypothetical protein